jgi:hypothetical protein
MTSAPIDVGDLELDAEDLVALAPQLHRVLEVDVHEAPVVLIEPAVEHADHPEAARLGRAALRG